MRQNITFNEVVTAAETILAKGDNPTIEKVRISIGSRGSNSTISKHLNCWRKHNNNHKECYVNHTKPLNENLINPNVNEGNNSNSEVSKLHTELKILRDKYYTAQSDLTITKNGFDLLHKHHVAWQNEKEQYIADLKQAHKISLDVLTENYRNDLNKLETKVNSLLDKIEHYMDKHRQERETFILQLQDVTNKLNHAKLSNRRIRRKLLAYRTTKGARPLTIKKLF